MACTQNPLLVLKSRGSTRSGEQKKNILEKETIVLSEVKAIYISKQINKAIIQNVENVKYVLSP
jgi:hypothetical protein